jgi:hypothetical protein
MATIDGNHFAIRDATKVATRANVVLIVEKKQKAEPSLLVPSIFGILPDGLIRFAISRALPFYLESKIMFLARPEGGGRLVILRRPITQPKKDYFGCYRPGWSIP